MKRLALLAALALAALPAALPARTLPPRDECAADPDFARFRAELLDIVARHDATRLLAVVADDIRFDFGGGEGRRAFAGEWGLADPDRSGLWVELAKALASGCARDGGTMSAPYIFRRFPDELDVFSSGVAGLGARLYRTQVTDGDSVPIPWEILDEAERDGGWTRVRLADGRAGFIETAHLLSPIDYRAIFEKRDGQWRMTMFIAGD
ncbi:MAG: hypothetical protein QOD42_2158 [Sphingomonadales bacterium]|jgi:ABC-type amino acid transport substrate-binding protein|nr:hypothetical protein [Sphingomonadales bacterium]